ncbi:Serine/threonine-protein phosphatase PP1 isozyme 8 [Tritrichomonas foetus]|uniref:Serine/threonine-protein phosphatase n=1 Tax=Tritrichomonas foetus TaxID=1144522 RepID=A0A1J4KP34_9EUKA|nr:Serine/threonine-protein phosphatase PP1 isozyme 8 [Tritrichomonas foetus]|eukprot:OHT11556.1 Serine/threonine-protein phosphatase PP1 isozyme 8 [Tritrichomonas foetus]
MYQEIIYKILSSRSHVNSMTKTDVSVENIQESGLPSISDISLLVNNAKLILTEEPVLLRLTGDYVVVGDIHGDIDTLIRIFEKNGYPPSQKYLFLGDMIDRGSNSLEVLILLFSLKCLFTESIYLLRGNHESKLISKNYGFRKECNFRFKEYGEEIFCKFYHSFSFLSIGALLNNSIFCVHGGISKDLVYIHDLEKNVQKPVRSILSGFIVPDLLWSVPRDYDYPFPFDEYKDSHRGCGHHFGPNALSTFLQDNHLTTLIRAHESCSSGFDLPFGSQNCLTLFSSVDYCGKGNNAAIANITNGIINIEIFKPICHEDSHKRRVLFPDWIISDHSYIDVDDFMANIENIVSPDLEEVPSIFI